MENAPGDRARGLLRPGPAWDHSSSLGQQEAIRDHIAHLVELIRDGSVEAAGPFHSADEHVGDRPVGLVIYTVSAREAELLMASDPAVAAGVMVGDVLPWYP